MKVVVVTGTPGAGKTTVLKGALKKLEDGYKVINFGDMMFETASKEGLVTDRDEMRKLPPEKQKEIQKLAASSIAGLAREEQIIVDTHCTIKTSKGYLPGLPEWVLKELKPSSIIVVEADSTEIMGRRNRDTSRIRDEESKEKIDEHQEMNRAIGMAYGMYTGATVKIIENHDNGLESAIKEMVKALR